MPFVNDRERTIGTYLYGRRMYDVMRYWATEDRRRGRAVQGRQRLPPDLAGRRQGRRLDARSTRSTPHAPSWWPTFDADAIRHRKATAAADLSIGGPTLAAEALRAGLVDEVALFLHPVAVGWWHPCAAS